MKSTKMFPREFELVDGRGRQLYPVYVQSENELQEKMNQAQQINPARGAITAHSDGLFYTMTQRGLKINSK